MLATSQKAIRSTSAAARYIQSTGSLSALKQHQKDARLHDEKEIKPSQRATNVNAEHKVVSIGLAEGEEDHRVKRNEVGVQLLSRKLHSQIFRNVSFPPPDRAFIQIAREHLESHDLDPLQGSVLPNTGFSLPPLQGNTIDEHFHRIGYDAAQPWLELTQAFAAVTSPPKPDNWHIQPGWTKYHYREDGSSYSESVPAPEEKMLSFDVETLPKYHNFAVLACAMSDKHWYSWISPWLLGEATDPQQLIPLGNPKKPRIVVGHNISYDRARVAEEYSVGATMTRFVDTMALHVAVKGISSHQRPAWMKHRKSKRDEKERKEEAIEVAVDLLRETEIQHDTEVDAEKRAGLSKLRRDIEESLPQLQNDDSDEAAAEASSQQWQDITSANSLADVAKLHCDIEVDKEIRNDFMTHSPAEILANVHDYLEYCSNDVQVTHAVFCTVLAEFLAACPSPVSFAGVTSMGSSFLTVNHEWETYLTVAEGKYRELEIKIKKRLTALGQEAKEMAVDSRWKNDPWLSQLDWTPKTPGKSRGVEAQPKKSVKKKARSKINISSVPPWYQTLTALGPHHKGIKSSILPILLRLSCHGSVLRFSAANGWTYTDANGDIQRPGPRTGKKVHILLGKQVGLRGLQDGSITSSHQHLAKTIASGVEDERTERGIMRLAKSVLKHRDSLGDQPWFGQLDWGTGHNDESTAAQKSSVGTLPEETVTWPKWYWELAKPKKGMPPGFIDITPRNRIAPLLLRLSWLGWPLFHSREHGWMFRVKPGANFETRQKELDFFDQADISLREASEHEGYKFYKLPHKDGDSANVGSPLAKTFMQYAQNGTLTSPGDEAKDALDMNAQCSYWISSRDRITKQMVVWQDDKTRMGFPDTGHANEKWGMILPTVITMGTVTRRAIEKTWLTASNAKKNRVGSELKAMVRAPPGYAIVGADVDSEELWISSAMGDAQFGLHGATALGWMTLEGTKAAGTDLHSKTASILGISRDQAKVFNYSRIYGAGMRHAMQLLLQSNPSMLPEEAKRQADKLYANTKGKNTHRPDLFGRKFWFGGTESFVFNKLEEIAISDRPQTPALGCGITYALSKEYLPPGFGTDYMTSRINWVVQSSGVDYLHLLIVSMDHLIAKYDIKARYLISVHDELRYLVAEEDKYRTALALQIANIWTRSLFAYRLGMDDLPQGVAFFSAVDVDKVLRKEVDLPCVTPSQPTPIPPGESLNITQILEKTNGGSLYRDGRQMPNNDNGEVVGSLEGYQPANCLAHRALGPAFLRAQATTDFGEVKRLAEMHSGKRYGGNIGGFGQARRRGRPRKLGDGVSLDMDAEIDRDNGSAV